MDDYSVILLQQDDKLDFIFILPGHGILLCVCTPPDKCSINKTETALKLVLIVSNTKKYHESESRLNFGCGTTEISS